MKKNLLIKSFCPTIYEKYDVKLGLLLCIIGKLFIKKQYFKAELLELKMGLEYVDNAIYFYSVSQAIFNLIINIKQEQGKVV